jgi:aminoglycoside phosphotransferase (APT) family kinase protein
VWAATSLPLILRRDPGRTSVGSDRGLEFAVLRAAHGAGVPVPEVLWLGDDPAILGTRFFIMERVEGEALARRLLRDPGYAEARRVMTGQLGAILAGIHAVPIEGPELAALPGRRDGGPAAAEELARYEELYRGLAPEPHPVIEYGLRWLRGTDPRQPAAGAGARRLSDRQRHVRPRRAARRARLGASARRRPDGGPRLDVRPRLAVRQPAAGRWHRRARRVLSRLRARRRATPWIPRSVRFWEALGDLKWAVICIAQAKTFLDGGVKSVELASIGRRTAEAEHDLLELVD